MEDPMAMQVSTHAICKLKFRKPTNCEGGEGDGVTAAGTSTADGGVGGGKSGRIYSWPDICSLWQCRSTLQSCFATPFNSLHSSQNAEQIAAKSAIKNCLQSPIGCHYLFKYFFSFGSRLGNVRTRRFFVNVHVVVNFKCSKFGVISCLWHLLAGREKRSYYYSVFCSLPSGKMMTIRPVSSHKS